MSLLARVRRFDPPARSGAPGTRVVVAAVRAARIRSRSRICCASSHAAGELRVAGARAFQPSASRRGRRRRAVRPSRSAESLGWPFVVEREDVAARARRERRSIEDAARAARHAFFERARAAARRRRRRARPHARRSGRDRSCCASLRGAGPRGLAAMSPAPRRHHPAAARLPPRRRCARISTRAARPFVEDESNHDVGDPAQPRARRAAAAARGAVQPAHRRRARRRGRAGPRRVATGWTPRPTPAAPRGSSAGTADGPCAARRRAALGRAPPALRRLVVWRAMTEAARRPRRGVRARGGGAPAARPRTPAGGSTRRASAWNVIGAQARLNG